MAPLLPTVIRSSVPEANEEVSISKKPPLPPYIVLTPSPPEAPHMEIRTLVAHEGLV
jgi:hypothetical protein